MEFIGTALEWIANDGAAWALTLFPVILLGIVGLYLLLLVVGYLRVSQVGIRAEAATQSVTVLPRAPDGVVEAPRGIPYCPVDGLSYPVGARFCTRCEADLLVRCANCAATIRAADESCYRCGTRSFTAPAAS